MAIPASLADALAPVTVIVGHYGAGKTNLSMNLAVDIAAAGKKVTVIDLDIVNPYFRASEQRTLLESHGVRLVAPVFAEAGTSLDVPSLTGQIGPAIQDAAEGSIVIIDAGGDDVGATALGRYSRLIGGNEHAVLYVANAYRNLVSDIDDALVNLREIEFASRLSITGIINNTHLKDATTTETIQAGIGYATKLADAADLPLVGTTVPRNITGIDSDKLYPVASYVKNPWE